MTDTFYPKNKRQPTRPDVDMLLERWPLESMGFGDMFYDREIEEILGISRKRRETKTRYETIIRNFKEIILEVRGLVLKRRPRQDCLEILSPYGVVEESSKSLTGMERTAKKRAHEVSVTKPRTPDESDSLMHASRGWSKVSGWFLQARQQFFSVEPPETLPMPDKSKKEDLD